ncbi:meiotic recombination protein REC8 homolog isoform X2 [Hoplias malabaricus]
MVNVQRTCNDIMDYVLVRVPPLLVGLPRPRFSLYLSSQLQYGVILIYHRQCQLLLEEIQEVIDRLLRSRTQIQIDMLPEDIMQHHTIPDALSLLNETEGARDPFFGLMEPGLPSPDSHIQLAPDMRQISPERRVTPPPDAITASQESITLPETEPVTLPRPEFEGAELQEFDMIEMLLEQPDDFHEEEAELERERLRERGQEEAIQREQERAVAEVESMRDLATISFEPVQSTELSSRDVVLEHEEVLDLPLEMPEAAEREITSVSELLPIPTATPSPEERRETLTLEPVPISPKAPAERRRRRRRQLVFIDEYTQISQEELQAQINDPRTRTRELESFLIETPSEKSDPKTLLSEPCMSLPPEILELWNEGAVIHPIPPSDRRVVEREREREEPEQRETEKEVPREMVESGISQYDTPVSSLVILETTEREMSPLETPEIRRSPVPVSVHGLEDIAEERVPEPAEFTEHIDDPLRRLAVVDEPKVTFHSLLPPVVSRRTVAQAFWKLLERIDLKEVSVQQSEPYGDIIIIITQIQQRQVE